MSLFDDLGLDTFTAIFDPADLAGTKSGKEAKRAAAAGAAEQDAAIQTAIGEQRRQFDITTGQLTEAEETNRAAIEAGRTGSVAAQQEGFGRQRRELAPFATAGRDALQQQQALLGLGSPEQQQQAFAAFNESPGQKFIRDRAQRNLVRNASAIGGLGGGNVRSALVQQGAGFAAQDFGNQFNRLSDLRVGGQSAATNIGQGALSTGTNVGQTQFNAGQLTGAGAINTAARQGQFGQNFASNVGNLAVQGGQARASGIFGQQQAMAQQKQGQQQAAATIFSSFSDPKLKDNIVKVGTANGFNWYNWTWNKLANTLGLQGESQGVMADEVRHIRPDLVSFDGEFMKVNYSGLGAI